MVARGDSLEEPNCCDLMTLRAEPFDTTISMVCDCWAIKGTSLEELRRLLVFAIDGCTARQPLPCFNVNERYLPLLEKLLEGVECRLTMEEEGE